MAHDRAHDSCCTSSSDNVRQSLSEMEFERGIWYAAQHNDLDRVEGLLKKGVSPDVEDSAGYTALHYAARSGHLRICEMLLRHGANVNACTKCGRATALHRAATQGHDKIVLFLLRNGAEPNLRDGDGCTALHRALLAGHSSVCEILIPYSDLQLLDNKGRSVGQLAEEFCRDALPFLSASKEN